MRSDAISGGEGGGAGDGFPSDVFTIRDDPGLLKLSVDEYLPLARQATATADALEATRVESWQGTEGELFRTRRAQFEPLIRSAAASFQSFHDVVSKFRDELVILKSRMTRLRIHAEQVWAQWQAARSEAARAATALTDTFEALQIASLATDASTVATAETAYRSAGAVAQQATARASALESEWRRCLKDADRIHAELREAADSTAGAIQQLPRPNTPPASSMGIRDTALEAARTTAHTVNGWFDEAGQWVDQNGAPVRDWLGRHADLVRSSGELASTIGKGAMALGALAAAAGVVGAPETGGLSVLLELPAGLLLTGGGLLWAAGDTAQAAADWGEKRTTGRQVLTQALTAGATAAIGGGVIKVAAKGSAKVARTFLPGFLEKLSARRAMGGASGASRTTDPTQFSEFADDGGAIARPAFPHPGLRVVEHSSGKNKVTFYVDPKTNLTVRAEGILREDFGQVKRPKVEGDAARTIRAHPHTRASDESGHIIAHRFLTGAGIDNHFPQNSHLNRSAYKKMENEWGDWINRGMEVHPVIEKHPPGAPRPDSLEITYEVTDPDTGRVLHRREFTLRNKSGESYDRLYPKQIDELIRNGARR